MFRYSTAIHLALILNLYDLSDDLFVLDISQVLRRIIPVLYTTCGNFVCSLSFVSLGRNVPSSKCNIQTGS
nr:unnamed protein product [Callosobruchus analis]